MISRKTKREQFEKEIIRHVQENAVTIVNTSDCGKMPVYLAEYGYKVIVAGSERKWNLYEKFTKACKDFNGPKNLVTFSNFIPYYSNDYQIIFMKYSAKLIDNILNNKDRNTVLIIEDSFNSINANLLFSLCKRLINEGAKLRLVIINQIFKYNDVLSHFFNGAPIIQVPVQSYYVACHQVAANEIENILSNLLLQSTHKNFLVLLPGKNEIEILSKKLHECFKRLHIDANILTLYSKLPFEVQKSRIFKHSEPRVILSTILFQTLPTSLNVDVVLDTGIEKQVKLIDGVETRVLRNVSKFTLSQRQALAGKYSPGLYYLCSDFNYNQRKEVDTESDANFHNMLLAILNFNIDFKSFSLLNAKINYHLNASSKLLQMLGAIDEERKVTEIGKEMLKIPLDVNFSRIMVEAKTYGVEFDALICCLILEFDIRMNSVSEIAYDSKSDLFGQLYSYKQLYLHNNSGKQTNQTEYIKSVSLLKKLLSILQITPSNTTDIAALKKCIACGFPNLLFICKKNIGYRNNDSDSLSYLFTDSALYAKKHRFIVGLPLKIFNISENTQANRILLPTAYTLEEVIEYYSKWFETGYSISGNNMFENQLYNGICITTHFIGTVESLKETDSNAFHEEKEISTKSGETSISLYFHNIKVNQM